MNKVDSAHLRREIVERLRSVIDPETNADVIRMRLVEELTIDGENRVLYTFKPSSPLCPIAVFLAQQIKGAVAGVPGVTGQHITVKGYIAADELTELINKEI